MVRALTFAKHLRVDYSIGSCDARLQIHAFVSLQHRSMTDLLVVYPVSGVTASEHVTISQES